MESYLLNNTGPGLRHFILTRFNLFLWTKDKEGNKVRTLGWLKHRFFLFESYCLPSIKCQTCKQFEWIVLFDNSTPEEFKDKVAQYESECPQFKPVYVDTQDGRHFADIFRREVSNVVLGDEHKDYDRVLTTYLDNDDALNKNFVEDIQKRVVSLPDGSFIYYTDGYQFYTDYHYLMLKSQPRNHFVSVVERADKEMIKTIYGYGSHYYIDKIPGARIIQVKDAPMWCEVVHEKNMGNDACSLLVRMVKDKKLLSSDFGIHQDVKYGIGLYLFRFLPRYFKTFVRRCKIRLRGYRFE